MSLDLYLRNGWIRGHETAPQEIQSLLAVSDRDIAQSQTPGLGPEWRFDIAYNAAVQLAVASLAASGFRAERQNKHQRSIECLAFTLGLEKKDVDLLDRCRRKRHTAVYEQVGTVSDQEADEMVRARHEIPSTFGRLHGRDASLLGLVVFSAYVFVLAPCLTSVRSASV